MWKRMQISRKTHKQFFGQDITFGINTTDRKKQLPCYGQRSTECPWFVLYVRNIIFVYRVFIWWYITDNLMNCWGFVCACARKRTQSLKAWRQSTNGLSRTALRPFQPPDTGVTKYFVPTFLFIIFGVMWDFVPWYWDPRWHFSIQK